MFEEHPVWLIRNSLGHYLKTGRGANYSHVQKARVYTTLSAAERGVKHLKLRNIEIVECLLTIPQPQPEPDANV